MRKIKLILVLILIFIGGCSVNKRIEEKKEPSGQIKLIVASDLHYLSSRLSDKGEYFQRLVENADGKYMIACEEILDAFVEEVIAQQPSALILSGDLTFNGAKWSHEDLAKKLSKIKQAGIPVYVLPGNHDLNNTMAASFHGSGYSRAENIDAKEFEEIYYSFGYESAICSDPDSLSYVAEITPDLWLLIVDVNSKHPLNQVSDKTMQWIEQQLQKASEKNIRVLSFTHQNLMKHNSLFYEGFVIENHAQLQELFRKYGVVLNLSGHMHMQHIKSEEGLSEIATSSLMISPNQIGIITMNEKSLEYHAQSLDITAWAKKNQRTGFENFKQESYDFFWQTSYRQALYAFGDEEDQQALAEFAADLNCVYFGGLMKEVKWDEELLEKIKKNSSFFSIYLQSILEEEKTDHQNLILDLK